MRELAAQLGGAARRAAAGGSGTRGRGRRPPARLRWPGRQLFSRHIRSSVGHRPALPVSASASSPQVASVTLVRSMNSRVSAAARRAPRPAGSRRPSGSSPAMAVIRPLGLHLAAGAHRGQPEPGHPALACAGAARPAGRSAGRGRASRSSRGLVRRAGQVAAADTSARSPATRSLASCSRAGRRPLRISRRVGGACRISWSRPAEHQAARELVQTSSSTSVTGSVSRCAASATRSGKTAGGGVLQRPDGVGGHGARRHSAAWT